jgi:TonB-linked SusC/RagA family outer membrane protein
MKKIVLMVFFASLCALTSLYAQERRISGRVTSADDGTPLPGVNVVIKGTTTGTVTDAEGNFALSISGSNQALVFSFIGLRTEEIAIGDRSTIDIALSLDVTQLSEVVVSGLASTIKRSNLANAVTTVNAKELLGTTQIQTADGALYGKVAGANIRSNGGAPGGGLSIQLRGISTLAGPSQPLIIVDGVYINNSFQRSGRATVTGAGAANQDDGANRLADLNPSEIESMEVLKGPSAAAIYGTRANAGVIVITTKKGKSGKTSISFNQDIGTAKPLRLLGVDNWSEDKINTFYNNPSASVQARRLVELQRFSESSNKSIDYEDYFYGNTGLLSNSRLSITGGDDKTRFFVSGTITDEEGTVKKTGFQRSSIRANIDHKINNNISVSLNSNYINSQTDRGFTGNQNNTGASIGYTMANVPNYFDLRPNALGIYPTNPYGGENPVALTDKAVNTSDVNRFIQSFLLDINLLKTSNSLLKFRANGGLDFLQNTTLVYLPEDLQSQRGAANPGDVFLGKQESFNSNFQAALVYDWSIGKVNLTSQAGIVRLDFQNDELFVRGRGLTAGQTNIKQATVQEVNADFLTRQQDAGIFLQQEANFEDKIIATAGIRWDKSTTNPDETQFFGFPRGSVAVNLTNFSFWGVKPISQLKPRVAYGQTAGAVPFGSIFTSFDPVNIGGRLGSAAGVGLGNTNIKPERAEEIEFGVDAGFLDNRISLEATYYIKTTKDNIQFLNLSPTTGVNTQPTNKAALENKGFELSLGATVIDRPAIRWYSRAMWWKNTATVTELDVPSYLTGAFGTGLGTFLIREGMSPFTIVGTPAISPGEFTVWGDSQPDFTASWFNTLTIFKNFDLNFMWEWRKGGDNINLTSFLTDSGGTTKGWFDDDNGDGIPNGRQRNPEPYNNAGRWVQDASFIKLREVGIYYNVPKTTTDKWFGNVIQRAKIGVSGNNVLLFTDYEGYDPETSTFGAAALANNVDIAPYPTQRRLFFHIQIDF